jgi:lipopolysaccharide export system protein LptC
MSELAERERIVRRGWAAPGGSHDRVIAILRIGLPAAVGIVLAFLTFAPLEEKQEVSFLLDKNKVEQSQERLRIQSAQYRGQDNRGRPFLLTARTAFQQSSTDPVVDIRGVNAQIMLENGPARLAAGRARYDMARDSVEIQGPIRLQAHDGYRLTTRDVTVDLRARTLTSRGAVDGQMPLGQFSAGQLDVDLPQRRAVLSGRARLRIVQRQSR